MTLALLLLIPLLAGLLMFVPGAWPRRGLLVATALAHLCLSCLTLRAVGNAVAGGHAKRPQPVNRGRQATQGRARRWVDARNRRRR